MAKNPLRKLIENLKPILVNFKKLQGEVETSIGKKSITTDDFLTHLNAAQKDRMIRIWFELIKGENRKLIIQVKKAVIKREKYIKDIQSAEPKITEDFIKKVKEANPKLTEAGIRKDFEEWDGLLKEQLIFHEKIVKVFNLLLQRQAKDRLKTGVLGTKALLALIADVKSFQESIDKEEEKIRRLLEATKSDDASASKSTEMTGKGWIEYGKVDLKKLKKEAQIRLWDEGSAKKKPYLFEMMLPEEGFAKVIDPAENKSLFKGKIIKLNPARDKIIQAGRLLEKVDYAGAKIIEDTKVIKIEVLE